MVNESTLPPWIYGPSFASSESSFQAGLPAGKYELGVQVPSGYDAQISVCERCQAGETAPFEPLGSFNGRTFFLHVVEHQNVHVEVKFTRQLDAEVFLQTSRWSATYPAFRKLPSPRINSPLTVLRSESTLASMRRSVASALSWN